MAERRKLSDPNATLLDQWIRKGKNNPLIAGLILILTAILFVLPFWDRLPRSFRDWFSTAIPVLHSGTVLFPDTGWVFAGYVDRADELTWASDQRVTLIKPSAAGQREHVFRNGDIIQPLKPVPQVIVDYRTRNTQNQLTPPWQVTEVIRKADDFTGQVYGTETRLEVMDVSVSQLPDQDFAVWLRVSRIAG